jgi:hypothetical protein
MTTPDGVSHISSRDNPLLKDLRKLAQDPGAYRKLGRVWLEGARRVVECCYQNNSGRRRTPARCQRAGITGPHGIRA